MSHTTIAALLLTLGLGTSAQQAPRDARPRPDATLQASFRSLLAASSAEEQRRMLESLRVQAGAAHERLVPQLFLFSQQATDTREAMLLGFVLAELRIPAEHVVGALVPLLETDEPATRAALGNVLSEYEHRSIERGADFTVYDAQLAQKLAPGLVRHLYATDPGAALLAVARAVVREPAELRPLLWAEHEVADALWKLRHGFLAQGELAGAAPEALAQVELLARDPRWWARLYAAEIGGEVPALLAESRLAELQRDEHPLVREIAAAARAEKR